MAMRRTEKARAAQDSLRQTKALFQRVQRELDQRLERVREERRQRSEEEPDNTWENLIPEETQG
jgi:hypothetical protein